MRSSASASLTVVFDCCVTVKPAAEITGTSPALITASAGTSRSVRRDAIQRDALLARSDVERRSGDHGLRHRAARTPVTDVDARRAGPTADDHRHGRQLGRADRLPSPRRRRERRGYRTAADTRRGRTVSLHLACSDMSRFGKEHFASQLPVTFTSLVVMSPCLQQQNIYSAECIYLLVLACMRFLLLSGNYRVCY